MLKCFNRTSIGFSHLKTGKRCQDYSCSYHDGERSIITACDGHGGKLYIRSDLGSKFASKAVTAELLKTEQSIFRKYDEKEISEKLKIAVLCGWNALVEQHLSEHRIAKQETADLSDEERRTLALNPEKAYGTTLNGVMVSGNKLVCVNLGDGGIFGLKRGKAIPVFGSEEDDAVANLTYSLCGEDAFHHLKVAVLDFGEYDGVIACTDGALNPYRNLPNFEQSFVNPVVSRLLSGKDAEVADFIDKLGKELGTGDDVTFSAIIKSETSLKRYKE